MPKERVIFVASLCAFIGVVMLAVFGWLLLTNWQSNIESGLKSSSAAAKKQQLENMAISEAIKPKKEEIESADRSILELELKIFQIQYDSYNQQLLVTAMVDKPLNKSFYVDRIDHGYLVFEGSRLQHPSTSYDKQELLKAKTGRSAPLFRFSMARPKVGTKFYFEWENYNPTTAKVEMKRSPVFVYGHKSQELP